MSREVIIKIRDDLDGSEADETVVFAYRGVSYEIDLSNANVELFDKQMDQFIGGARKVTGTKTKEVAPPPPRYKPVDAAVKEQRKEIREWANRNGFTVDGRGMIASAVFEAFQDANPTVELLPGTATRYSRSKANDHLPAVTKLTAQQANDGLISAAELLGETPNDRHGRDRRGEKFGKAQRNKIREWAVAEGYDQAPTGMVKQAVLDAYYEAHPGEGIHAQD